MTFRETTAIMAYLKANYPNAFKDQTKEEAQMVIGTWTDVFKDYSPELVMAAIKAFISSDTKGFMPVPGSIMQIIRSQAEADELTPQQAWSLVRSKIDFYKATSNYKSLPKDIQVVLGSPDLLADLHTADGSTLQVAASNFMKSYQAYMNRKHKEEAIPNSVMLELKKLPFLGDQNETLPKLRDVGREKES